MSIPLHTTLVEDRGYGLTIQDLLNRFRSELDDEGSINKYFNDAQLVTMLARGMQYVNTNLKYFRKYDYLCVKPYQDNYVLPSDFMEAVNIFDIDNQVAFDYAKFNMVRSRKAVNLYNYSYSLTDQKMFQIDEIKKRMYLDIVPDDATFFTQYDVYFDASLYNSLPVICVGDGDTNTNWFDPVFIMLTNAAKLVSYCRVSKIDAVYDGNGTLTWSGKDFTLVTGDETYLNAGDVIEVAYVPTQEATITIDIGRALVTATAHGLNAGDRIKFTTTGALPTGLSINTDYYVIGIGDDTFYLATSYANYVASTYITISDAGSGTHTVYKYQDDMEIQYEEFTIDTVGSGTFTVTETPLWNNSVAVPYIVTDGDDVADLTPLKKLYITEQNITRDYPRFSTATHMYLVDYVMEYFAQPFLVKQSPGTISFSTVTGTVAGTFTHHLAVGDYVVIGSEMRKITAIGASPYITITVDSAFTETISGASFRYLRMSEQVMVPNEIIDVITLASMWYAYQRESDDEMARMKRGEADRKIEDVKGAIVADELRKVSLRQKGYDEGFDREIPYAI